MSMTDLSQALQRLNTLGAPVVSGDMFDPALMPALQFIGALTPVPGLDNTYAVNPFVVTEALPLPNNIAF